MNTFTVLNTRPAHQSLALTTAIEKKGGTVFNLPLFNIESVLFTPPDLKKFSVIIFQSHNAVIHFLKQYKTIETNAVFIAIGSATQKTLENAGYHTVLTPAQFSSEGVLTMPVLKAIQQKSILIVSGENPKPLLRKTLAERGAVVETVFCYRRVPIHYNLSNIFSELKAVDIVVITSSESFAFLCELFKSREHRHWLVQKTLCVINNKMKSDAVLAGFQDVIEARNATDDAIVTAIISHAFS